MRGGTRHPEYKHALPGYGAFKKADRDDAKRREPATDLRPYAESRGWEFLDRQNPVGYFGVISGDSRLQFNVLRGLLPGDRPGVLGHKLHEVGVGKTQDGARYTDTEATVHGLTVPLAFNFFRSADPRPMAVGVPTTVAAALVPEVATVPGFDVGNYPHGDFNITKKLKATAFSDSSRINLKDFGVPGVWLEPILRHQVPPDFLERLAGASFADILSRYKDRPFMRVKVDHGRVSILVDGWIDDPGELDGLRESVAAAASALAEAGAPIHRPQPFDRPLPSADWSPDMPIPRSPKISFGNPATKLPPFSPPVEWLQPLAEFARERHATPEAPIDYHLAFPHLPAPGTAFAVLRFTPPGTSTVARVAWHAEQTIAFYNTGRNVFLLPAATSSQPTPPGSVRRADLQLNYAVSEGIFAAWERRDGNAGEMDALVQRALRLAHDEGLAEL